MVRLRRRRHSHDPILSKGIIAVLLFIFAIIIGLSFFEKAGTIGIMLNEYVLNFLFGSIRYMAPIVIIILAWFLIRDIEYYYRATHGIGAVLFLLALSSLMHIGYSTDEMWIQSLEGNGGGVFGMLAWPLKTYLGSIAGVVILVGLAVVAFLLVFNTSITHFIMLHRKFMDGMGWFGRLLVQTVSALFVKKEIAEYNEDSDIEKNIDDESDEEEDEEEEEQRRLFSKRKISIEDRIEENEEDEDLEDEEDEFPITRTLNSRTGSAGPTSVHPASYTQNVVIRPIPPVSLLSDKKSKPTSGDIKINAEIIADTLSEFNIDVTMGEARVGPTVTQFSFKPSKGVKLSRITTLSNDLALALAAHPIRIEAPIPGKSLVGVEVPNQKAAIVTFRELLESKEFKERAHNMMIGLGKDVAGKVWFADLPRMPHLLVAGATGSGKTVCVNTIIMSLLYQNTAETLRFIMVDPKRVELTLYNGIPHLLTPVITNVKHTVNALKWTVNEMDRRFELLSKNGARNIDSYNKKRPNDKLPHIIFVIDELADLMATAANEVEAGIIRLAQMARAVGIHLLLATQRPSVDVITGLMKANIPARIAFSVASIVDSRTILDSPGAEKLIGRGDMLYSCAELSKPVRIQGSFISESELKKVVKHLKDGEKPEYDMSIMEKGGSASQNMFGGETDDYDPLFNEAKEIIMENGKASASFLQRRMRIGYARAARILDEMEEAGLVGPTEGAKPREILVTKDQTFATIKNSGEFNVYSDLDDEEVIDEEDDLEELEENEDKLENNTQEKELEEEQDEDEELDEDESEEELEDDESEEEEEKDRNKLKNNTEEKDGRFYY